MCDCAEDDPAVIYSAVRNDNISYEQIFITDKQEKSKIRGTAALLCLHLGSFDTQTLRLWFSGVRLHHVSHANIF